MAEEERRKAIRQAVKERIKKSEELQITQMVTDAIGERRHRDLRDLVSQLEQDQGWSRVLEHLSKSRELSYNLPLGIGPHKSQLEELKYRETIFTLLECEGFEPIPLTIEEIFSKLQNEDSLLDASRTLFTECESLASKQIELGDTLFYDLNSLSSTIPPKIIKLLEEAQHNKITSQSLMKQGTKINILPLWYCEKGRQALSHLGIRGTEIDSNTFDIVLSVLQIPIRDIGFVETEIKEESLIHPSNPLYERLLRSIMHQDIESLNLLSSRQSYETLKFILNDTIDQYETSPSSSNFRNILSCINTHIRIRTYESITPLEELIHSQDTRIATTAITALGNFYTESATIALVNLLCDTKNNEVVNTTIRAIKNINRRCTETKYIIRDTTNAQSCTNVGRVKRLFKEIWKESDDYYL